MVLFVLFTYDNFFPNLDEFLKLPEDEIIQKGLETCSDLLIINKLLRIVFLFLSYNAYGITQGT